MTIKDTLSITRIRSVFFSHNTPVNGQWVAPYTPESDQRVNPSTLVSDWWGSAYFAFRSVGKSEYSRIESVENSEYSGFRPVSNWEIRFQVGAYFDFRWEGKSEYSVFRSLGKLWVMLASSSECSTNTNWRSIESGPLHINPNPQTGKAKQMF